MTTRNDPLAAPRATDRASVLDRVFYATGIMLSADDFAAEQAYHRGRLARALRYLHDTGTVAGLRVVVERALAPGANPAFPEGREEELRVQPGLAVDRLGRLIEIPREVCLRLDHWYRAEPVDRLRAALHGAPDNGVIVDVFVRYVTCDRAKTPAFAAGPFDALGAVQPSRLRDGYELALIPREEANPPLPDQGEAPPPLPPAGPARLKALQDAIFDRWREGTNEGWTEWEGPERLREHVQRQDPTSLFLARLVLPATAAATADARPDRTPGVDVTFDNTRRRFVYSTLALARSLEIVP